MDLIVANATIGNISDVSTVASTNFPLSNNINLGVVTVNTTQITVGSSTITPSLLSVPVLTLGGASWVGGDLGQYQGIVNTQTFTSNGTWTNPISNTTLGLTSNSVAFIMMWGGGGGGAPTAGGGGAGGGGGACLIEFVRLGDMSATCAVTVGQGGSTAASGANTTFAVNGSVTLVATGGGPGLGTGIGGGGGGVFALGVNANGGAPLGGTVGQASTYGGGGGSNNTVTNGVGGFSIFGGAGGGGQNAGNNGGDSIYGGAGGAGKSSTGGVSIFGGNSNTAPGGGGSSTDVGQRGEVRIWVLK